MVKGETVAVNSYKYPYNQNVVREFYVNLTASCGHLESPRYGMVYVRGQDYSFTP